MDNPISDQCASRVGPAMRCSSQEGGRFFLNTPIFHIKWGFLRQDGIIGVGGHKKCRKALWTLAEASRNKKRRLWRCKATVSVSMFQDGRKAKLNVRFRGANADLDRVNGGYVGSADLAKDYSLDSIGIQRATLEIWRRFATFRRDPPYCTTNQNQSSFDQELYDRILHTIETAVSDSAYDEIRALQMLAGQTDVVPPLWK